MDVHGGTSAGGLRLFAIVQHNVDDAVVYATGASASAALATGPDGELVDVTLTMAPGLPMFRWGATAFPGATEQWLNATDHSKGCTAVAP